MHYLYIVMDYFIIMHFSFSSDRVRSPGGVATRSGARSFGLLDRAYNKYRTQAGDRGGWRGVRHVVFGTSLIIRFFFFFYQSADEIVAHKREGGCTLLYYFERTKDT